jgi:hypothetical protein
LATAPPPEAPPSGEPAAFVYGASFALVPSFFLLPDNHPPKMTQQPEFAIGLGAELGASLTPGFEIFARVMVDAGTKGKPVSDIMGAGPGMSFRVGRRWWIGATLYTGRGEMSFDGYAYSTDWVFAPTLDISFAAIEWHSGQWLVSASPGYFFVNVRQDNPLLFLPLTFGYRSY